jgi:hypothetical protein
MGGIANVIRFSHSMSLFIDTKFRYPQLLFFNKPISELFWHTQ